MAVSGSSILSRIEPDYLLSRPAYVLHTVKIRPILLDTCFDPFDHRIHPLEPMLRLNIARMSEPMFNETVNEVLFSDRLFEVKAETLAARALRIEECTLDV